jgi:glucose/arabinose dehydrogenase
MCRCADSALHPLYGTLVRVDPVSAAMQVVVRGVRNSLGIMFHPTTGDLWFTDNGSARARSSCR